MKQYCNRWAKVCCRSVFTSGFSMVLLLVATSQSHAQSAAESEAQQQGLPHGFDAGWKGMKTCTVLYETPEVQVGQCSFAPGVGHEKHYHNPHFGYVIEGSTMQVQDASGERELTTKAGDTWSTTTVTVHQAINIGTTTARYLIVEPRPLGSDVLTPASE